MALWSSEPAGITPQGGVVSPLLANLFLHYAFDLWMTRTHPELPWCRYADDGLVHCRNEQEAEALRAELQARLAECHLEMHPTKTKIVYCKGWQSQVKAMSTRGSTSWGVTASGRMAGEESPGGAACSGASRPRSVKSGRHRHAGDDSEDQLAQPDPDHAGRTSPPRSIQSYGAGLSHYGRYCPSALLSGVPPCQQDVGGMGDAEVQAPRGSQNAGRPLP